MPLPELGTPYLLTFGDHRVPLLVTGISGPWIYLEFSDDERIQALHLPARIKKRHWNAKEPVQITEELVATHEAQTETETVRPKARPMSRSSQTLMMVMLSLSGLGSMHPGPPPRQSSVKPSPPHRHPRTFRGRK